MKKLIIFFSLLFVLSDVAWATQYDESPSNNTTYGGANTTVSPGIQNAPSLVLVPNVDEAKAIDKWFDKATYGDFEDEKSLDLFSIPTLKTVGN